MSPASLGLPCSRNRQATKKTLSVSAYQKETAINTPQTLDLQLVSPLDSIINLTQETQDNSDHSTGQEEATRLYRLGFSAVWTYNDNRAMPQLFAFLLAYAMGNTVSGIVPDTNNEVYDHVITCMDGFEACANSNPGFTAGQNLSEVRKELIYSNYVSKVVETYPKNDFVSISADIVATGAHETNVQEDTITAFDDVVQLTLTQEVPGVDDAARQKNIDAIVGIVIATGERVYITDITSVAAGATPIVVFTNPGLGATSADTTWIVTYIIANAALDTLPAINDEQPLRTTNLSIIKDGVYDSGDIIGGYLVNGEVTDVEVSYENEGLVVESVPGGTEDAGNRAVRKGRIHSISLSEDLARNLNEQGFKNGDIFAVKLVAEGTIPLVHGGVGVVYPTVTHIFPQCQYMSNDIGVTDKLLTETAVLLPLGDATNPVRETTVRNKIAAYAA
ncbi:hypothetical protein KAR91_31295 [Candidatus Pacearchaeota archaeon]|nr:hypothetical protein [Candidatus Pacearchaeota archaeon]